MGGQTGILSQVGLLTVFQCLRSQQHRPEKWLDRGGGRGENKARLPRSTAVRSPADRLLRSKDSMRKEPAGGIDDDLRPEYDLSQLKGGVRGKYYRQAKAGTNLVLIEPELVDVFRDAESVNRALRL